MIIVTSSSISPIALQMEKLDAHQSFKQKKEQRYFYPTEKLDSHHLSAKIGHVNLTSNFILTCPGIKRGPKNTYSYVRNY